MSSHEVGLPPAFPPSLVVQVKALACELPHRLGLPLSRLSIADIRQHVITQGLVAEISGATLWRWLSSDALRPWQHRSRLFRRLPLAPCESSTSTFAKALGPTWPRGRCIAPRSSAAAKSRTALLPWIALLVRS